MTEHDEFDYWKDLFRPLENHLCASASYAGHLFGTSPAEYRFIVKAALLTPGRVWTLAAGESGGEYLRHGLWQERRIGYFIAREDFDEFHPDHRHDYFERDVLVSRPQALA